MPFWSDETWRAANGTSQSPVEPFDESRLEEAKYIMSVGEEVYVSSSPAQNSPIRKLSEDESFSIAPGQFAHILTKERVRMPLDAIGFISMNATTKFAGLVNISGFHVDPGYNGRIIFAVFNAGPNAVTLRRGEGTFPLWIATLDKPTRNTSGKPGYDQIPGKLITNISGNFTTAFEVNEVVGKLRGDFDETSRKLRSDLDDMKMDVATMKATRVHLLVLVGILSLLFGGMFTAVSKMVYNWVTEGPPVVQTGTTNIPATTPPAPVAPRTTSPAPQLTP
jgi:dCTP deaminase